MLNTLGKLYLSSKEQVRRLNYKLNVVSARLNCNVSSNMSNIMNTLMNTLMVFHVATHTQ